MPEQLTIFDVEPVTVFDIKKTNVRRVNSKVRFTDIIVQIPSKAKAIDELPKTTAPDDCYELFEEYTLGIWRYKRVEDKGFDWERAEELCKYVRDIKESIPIRLHLSVEQLFKPEYVLKYL
ncbi:cell division protein SepF [Bacillus cereus]|uniref:cell division protein SepF n=1 Tax=Bacillus TaxID=1386 RepID=UPI000A37AF74|nr:MULTISPECIES: cell division protein SepF [Bacillus]MEB8736518.1 cell division protein SepF [Bacillus cereus]MDM5036154.1 cell division protein SepF [Bacillus sp. OR-18]MEB8905345.1 cell division protein SepF [Bacillus cereus]MEB9922980.1 cell division protein SepF [Bacillus cereus]MEB9986152.1 cell division protein SepF [Bacillus cereus]